MRTENAIDGISLEQASSGVRLSSRVAAAGAGADREFLCALELAAPGDTRLEVEADAVVARRFLAEPSDAALHEAAAALAKITTQLAKPLAARATARAAGARRVPEPQFADLSWVASLLDGYFTVEAPQPGWQQPDPSASAITQLRPGAWYRVTERAGDWARVSGEDGVLAWVDARTLRPVIEGERR